jgi:hypothetical protein
MSDGWSEEAGMLETETPREAVWRIWEDVPGWTERERTRLDRPFEDGTRGGHELAETGAGRRRITHRMTIFGPLASLFVRVGGTGFANGLPYAMRRVANLIEQRPSAVRASLSSNAKRKVRR